ncbi:MAG: helix-hairpin-helix domain-containing protein [Anaerolineae bacterium]
MPAWRRVNYGDWIAQARLAAGGNWEGLKVLQATLFTRQEDALTLISGIGEKTAAALTAAGITSFGVLAAVTPEQLAGIVQDVGLRGGDYGAWIEEAKLRATGKRITRARPVQAGKVMASYPQDLLRVKGIGSVYEQKLYAAGIGTFWELSQTDDTTLADILELKDFRAVDLAAIKEQALRLAEETGTVGRRWDGTPPDDFEPLEGIGPVYEGHLYDTGICTYRAPANATVEQLAGICRAPEWRRPDYAS